jgi:hypothetical protein
MRRVMTNDHDIRLLTFAITKYTCYEHDAPAPKYSHTHPHTSEPLLMGRITTGLSTY